MSCGSHRGGKIQSAYREVALKMRVNLTTSVQGFTNLSRVLGVMRKGVRGTEGSLIT